MSDKVFLSVIIPCYNEMENLQRGVLDEVRQFLEKQNYHWEVIVSDDGSTDQSPEFIQKFIEKNKNFRLLLNPHRGKPFAIWEGIRLAKGQHILFTDMDQSTPISEVGKLLPYFKRGFSVVIGSRGEERKGFPWYRRVLARGFRLMRRFFILPNIVDTQCGFKAFKRKAALDIFSRLQVLQEQGKAKGWKVTAFDVELLFVAQKRGHRIAEVPVDWFDADVARGKKRNFLRESWEMGREVLRVKLNEFFGFYEK